MIFENHVDLLLQPFFQAFDLKANKSPCCFLCDLAHETKYILIIFKNLKEIMSFIVPHLFTYLYQSCFG